MGAGKDFITSFGYAIAEDEQDFRRILAGELGDAEAREVMRALDSRADQKRGASAIDHRSFYRMKNANLRRSLAISIGYEGDLLVRTCDWIAAHPESFGETILDQGCDVGLLSLFMAKTFPGKQITAIDVCPESIRLAEELRIQLGIENARFLDVNQWKRAVKTAVKDVAREDRTAGGNRAAGTAHAPKKTPGTYDTVFTSRTLQENLESRRLSGLACSPFVTKAEEKRRLFLPYVRKLCGRTARGGNLIAIERVISRYPLSMQAGALAHMRGQVSTLKGAGYAVHPCRQNPDGAEIVQKRRR